MRHGVDENRGAELARRVAGILQAISDRSLAAIHAFAQSAPASSRVWLDDVDKAMAFATELEIAAVGVDAAGGVYDGSVAVDPSRQDAVEALVPRGDRIVVALDAILRLARKDMLYAMADAIQSFGTLGLEKLEALRAYAAAGRLRTVFISSELRRRKPLLDRHLPPAGDGAVAEALTGLEGSIARFESFSGGWHLATTVTTVLDESGNVWAAAHALRAIGQGGAADLAAALEGANPFRIAFERVSVAISIGETIADLGLAKDELAEMHELLGYARAVQAQYGPAIDYFDEHLREIRILVSFFAFLLRTAERVALAVEDAERHVGAAGLR
jgi:hypothetical protein